MASSRWFSARELACPCCGLCSVDLEFLDRLDKLRQALGQPLTVNSCCRCKAHNASLPNSSPTSHHMPRPDVGARAVDLACPPALRDKIQALAPKYGFTGVGLGSDFIHIDTGHAAATTWTYP